MFFYNALLNFIAPESRLLSSEMIFRHLGLHKSKVTVGKSVINQEEFTFVRLRPITKAIEQNFGATATNVPATRCTLSNSKTICKPTVAA